jgi:hypothetical protein
MILAGFATCELSLLIPGLPLKESLAWNEALQPCRLAMNPERQVKELPHQADSKVYWSSVTF